MKRQRLRILLACSTTLCLSSAHAAAVCSVTAIGPAFGIYDPLSASATLANGSITTTCSIPDNNQQTVSIVSSYSTGSSNSYAARTMLSGVNQLLYNLYFDAAFTQIVGNGGLGGRATFNLNNGHQTQSTTWTIYGRAPALQDVAPGTYTDTVTVTITY